jgi:hypothetical protein
MDRAMKGVVMLAALAAIAACDPADRVEDPAPRMDTVRVSADQEIQAHFQAFRTEVASSLDELRSQLDQMRQELETDFEDWWVDASTRIQEHRDSVEEELARLDEVTVREAEGIRRQASERLAESEADVVAGEVKASSDLEVLAQRAEEHLRNLEATLDSIDLTMREREEPVRDEAAREEAGPEVDYAPEARQEAMDAEALSELRVRVVEVRAELSALPTAEAEEWREIRESLGDELAALTRDVREQWYTVKWRVLDS